MIWRRKGVSPELDESTRLAPFTEWGVGWHGGARWIGTRVRWTEQGEVSLTATYEETRDSDRIVNETPRAIGGINELTSPAEQCTE